MPHASCLTLHATCVSIKDKGVLLLGPSGCGKSDLALRLIDSGAALVGDDQVEVRRIYPPPLEGGVRGGAHSSLTNNQQPSTNIPPILPSPSGGEGILVADPPQRIQGMIEARGAGILHMPYAQHVPLALAVRLVDRDQVERMPHLLFFDCLGLRIPLLSLHAFDVSTPSKIRLYLRYKD